jgi:hypothetical protein
MKTTPEDQDWLRVAEESFSFESNVPIETAVGDEQPRRLRHR